MTATLYDLAALGDEMRKAQTRYFKTRAQNDLVLSKTLEKTFDAAVQHILNVGAARTPVLPPDREGFRRHWFLENDSGPNPSSATLLGFRFVTENGIAVVRPEPMEGRAFLMEVEEDRWVQINMRF